MRQTIYGIKNDFLSTHFVKYLIAGLTGLFIDTLVLIILEKTVFQEESYEILEIIYPAKLISSVFGVGTAFIINKYWSFKSTGDIRVESVKITISFIFTILVSVPIYGIYFKILETQPFMELEKDIILTVSNILTAASTMLMNFFIQKYLIFKDRKV
jgi:putative flippase GtrA